MSCPVEVPYTCDLSDLCFSSVTECIGYCTQYAQESQCGEPPAQLTISPSAIGWGALALIVLILVCVIMACLWRCFVSPQPPPLPPPPLPLHEVPIANVVPQKPYVDVEL
jgi:hypothetical protein